MEDDIAERLREENPEQFFILVRMHLSFIIDMNTTDENDSPNDKPKTFKWGFSKKFKGGENGSKASNGPNKAAEPVSLTEEIIKQIYHLMDILSEESNLIQEGIFRRTGSLSRQQQLRRLLASGGKLDGDASYSAHDMASVLKGMLADTPEPLLLNQHYQAYCHLATTCFSEGQPLANSESKLIGAIRLLLLFLPSAVRQLAKRLLVLLHQVASYEASNRMSPGALATMFTPHVLCPRRLSPEALHMDSQSMAPVLGFMIKKATILFIVPPQLATDIAAYLAKKQHRRLLSPNGEDLNESVSERTAASTVFTFVDRQMSGVTGNDASDSGATTDAALAQLYAHIQSLPESHNKRRLIKQFNRENGHGTPLQLQRSQKHKSLGESLKKHIFNKSLMSKSSKKPVNLHEQRFGYNPAVESPSMFKNSNPKLGAVKLGLSDSPKPFKFQHSNLSLKNVTNNATTIPEVIVSTENPKQNDEQHKYVILKEQPENYETEEDDDVFLTTNDDNLEEASYSCDEGGNTLERVERLTPKYTSEPNLSFLPSSHEMTPKFTKNKNSKLFKSKTTLQTHVMARKDSKKHDIQKLQKQKRNSFDDKIKETSDHSLTFKSCVKCSTDSFSETDCSAPEFKPTVEKAVTSPRSEQTPRLYRKDSLKYMRNKRINKRASSTSLKEHSPLTEETACSKSSEGIIEGDSCTPKAHLLSMKNNYLTSTPAIPTLMLNSERNYEGCSTPMFAGGVMLMRRGSMSPITKSTQKMPKAMQESIMTPRSRKPVIINCDPPTTMIPCNISHHSTSDTTSSDTVYDSTPSSMKNDSDFVSTDESCPSSCYIKYKHIDDTKDNTSKDKSNSSIDNFTSISDSVLCERRLRIMQERKYHKLLEKKHPGGKMYHVNSSKTGLINEKSFEDSDSESSPDLSVIKVENNTSLTGPFRQYLLNRSVLTGSPVDLSFASGPEDYCDSRTDNIDSISEGKMTDSLLYCMNGNVPSDLTLMSDFDCSDKVALLKKDDSDVNFESGSTSKQTTNLDNIKYNTDVAIKKLKPSQCIDISLCDNAAKILSSDIIDKENLSPGIKRPAHSLGNTIEQEATGIKKVNVSVGGDNVNVPKDSEQRKINVMLERDQDLWEYNRYGPLWETNL